MKHNNEQINKEDSLITDVISSFRSVSPSYEKTKVWYLDNAQKPKQVRSLNKPILSKYSLPLFGSVFASALAVVMILTSQNNVIQNGEMPVMVADITFTENQGQIEERYDPITFATIADQPAMKGMAAKTIQQEQPLLEKIEAQSRASSRTQADESFTESLNVNTSLQDLFQ